MMRPYAPLRCKSNFSFLEGASHPEELVKEAVRLGLPALAITDRNGVYGIVRAHMAAKEHGLKLVIGAEVECGEGTGSRASVVLLARNREGYGRLCRLLTKGHRATEKGSFALEFATLADHAEGLTALIDGVVFENASRGDLERFRAAFDGELYARVSRHRAAGEIRVERGLRAHARAWNIPLVAANEVLYHTAARRPLQDVLTCIRHGVKLWEAGTRLKPNNEHGLKAPEEFAGLFADEPELIGRSMEIAERCSFRMDEIRYRYPSSRCAGRERQAVCPPVETFLRALTFQGARERYGDDIPEAARRQIEKELALIEELDYGGYFMTMKEIVDYCREQAILCQGRGSAANSVVCYCLGITAIDPIRMDLLFERFISRERNEPPDIDLDIEHDRREEVIQHVYAMYGRDHAAMVANVIRYRARSAVREVGKVFGMPETMLGRIAKLVSSYGEVTENDWIHIVGANNYSPLQVINEIIDFPRHLSIHPGGFLLGHEPVHDLVPIENGSMEDRTVIQWDKTDIEDLGLFKVDLLGLGALTHLRRTFDMIKKHRGEEYSMASIPAEDPATYDMICRAETVGVFQVESRAQMAMLPRLRPRNFYDLVVEISMIRPGPITGGMVHPYLRRRRGLEEVTYPHPLLEPVLKKTLGIPLFQEQVMKLAMVAADYTPGESDQLRRDMAAWRQKGRIQRHRERLIARMTAKGIPLEFAERVFEQIKGFGEYGFPESHAASFALIAYATAWLRRHYPVEFTCGLLNAQPMGFYTPATIIDDAKRHGVAFREVDVSASNWDCTVENRPSVGLKAGTEHLIRIGLRYVKGLSRDAGDRIVAEREARPYASLADFMERSALDEGSLRRLAASGALNSFGGGRRDELWKVLGLARQRERAMRIEEKALPLFAALDDPSEIAWDYASTGHSIRAHPLAAWRAALLRQGFPTADEIRARLDGARIRYAGFVICRQHPGTAKGVTFLTMEDETGFVNIVIWKKIFDRHRALIKGSDFLGVSGKIQAQDGLVHLIADRFWKPKLDHSDGSPRAILAPRSRDFM